jgi:transposase
MAKVLVRDEPWAIVEPLLPNEPPKPKGGRPRVPNRAALTGILFVLKTGIPWEYLPQEMGCGSGMTCWRRLRDWNEANLWHRLHTVSSYGWK